MKCSPCAADIFVLLLLTVTPVTLRAQQDQRPAEASSGGASPEAAHSAAARAAAAHAIGVVDFERVKAGVPRWKASIETLKSKKVVLSEELSALQQQVREKELKRDSFEPNTIEYVRENAEVEGSTQALKTRAQDYERWMERRRAEVEDHFIRELRQATAKVAGERGLSLVLRVRNLETDDGLGQRLQTFALNDVLWHAPTLDLTEDVIRILKSTSSSPAPAPAESSQGGAGNEKPMAPPAGTAGADAVRGK